MSYSGFGIQTMSSLQKPRKVFSSRIETKGRSIRLHGKLSLVKDETVTIVEKKTEQLNFFTVLLRQITVYHNLITKAVSHV